jgi:hypothetical protein
MSNAQNGNGTGGEAGQPGQLPGGEQVHHFQRAITEQVQRVTQSLDSIAEAFNKGTVVSRKMMNHAQAQILRLHLHLDDLKQWLDSIG